MQTTLCSFLKFTQGKGNLHHNVWGEEWSPGFFFLNTTHMLQKPRNNFQFLFKFINFGLLRHVHNLSIMCWEKNVAFFSSFVCDGGLIVRHTEVKLQLITCLTNIHGPSISMILLSTLHIHYIIRERAHIT